MTWVAPFPPVLVDVPTPEPVEGQPWWVSYVLIPLAGAIVTAIVARIAPKPPTQAADDDEDATPGSSPPRAAEWDAAYELVQELKADKAELAAKVDRMTARIEVLEDLLMRLGQTPPP